MYLNSRLVLLPIFLILCLTAPTLAAQSDAAITPAKLSRIKAVVKAFTNAEPGMVRKSDFADLYEVAVGNDIFYVTPAATHIISGHVFDVATRQDLTAERQEELGKIKFSDLPLDLAIKRVKGNGQRVFATVEDPNCGYCKKLAQEIEGMDNITVYTFLVPLIAADSADKIKAIWCSKDRSAAFVNQMTKNEAPEQPGNCNAPIDRLTAFGQKYYIRATPTLYFANGDRSAGAMTAQQLETRLGQ